MIEKRIRIGTVSRFSQHHSCVQSTWLPSYYDETLPRVQRSVRQGLASDWLNFLRSGACRRYAYPRRFVERPVAAARHQLSQFAGAEVPFIPFEPVAYCTPVTELSRRNYFR
jgi:hypothetical protein